LRDLLPFIYISPLVPLAFPPNNTCQLGFGSGGKITIIVIELHDFGESSWGALRKNVVGY